MPAPPVGSRPAKTKALELKLLGDFGIGYCNIAWLGYTEALNKHFILKREVNEF